MCLILLTSHYIHISTNEKGSTLAVQRLSLFALHTHTHTHILLRQRINACTRRMWWPMMKIHGGRLHCPVSHRDTLFILTPKFFSPLPGEASCTPNILCLLCDINFIPSDTHACNHLSSRTASNCNTMSVLCVVYMK